MAHPMKKELEGVTGHNAKLKRMTRHYGDADPAMKKNAPVDMDKTEGPEEVPEFGADSAAPNARADRPARRTTAANPLSTYARGGSVKARARGGRAKGKTNININISPSGPGGPQGQNGMPPPVLPVDGNPAVPPPPAGAPPQPPMPLMGAGGPGMMPPGAGSLPPGMMPPGAMPPGTMPPRKSGGRVKHRDSGGDVETVATDNTSDYPKGMQDWHDAVVASSKRADSEPAGRRRGGRSHPDAAEDKSLVRKMVKPDALKHRAKGGSVQNLQLKGNRAHMTAGSESGPGRLEKAHARKRNAKSEHPQAV